MILKIISPLTVRLFLKIRLPGNKAGGITTLEDKSLGCVQKGGKAEVCDVLKYGESLRSHGLNLLQGPGQ